MTKMGIQSSYELKQDPRHGELWVSIVSILYLVWVGLFQYRSVLLQLQLHSRLNTWLQSIGQKQLQDETSNI